MRSSQITTAAGARGVRAAVAALACLAVFAAGAPCHAADPGIRVGYFGGKDADDPVPVVGVFGRADIPGPLNLEVSADYRKESLRGGDMKAVVVPVRASAVLSFLPVVSPYLLAGVGADYTSISFHDGLAGQGDVSDVVFEAHAGGGVEFGLGPISVVGDLRYCAAQEVDDAKVRAALGHAYSPSGWYASLSAGISF